MLAIAADVRGALAKEAKSAQDRRRKFEAWLAWKGLTESEFRAEDE